MKACTKCGETKPLEDFPNQARMSDGKGSWCKVCKYRAQQEWRDANPEKYKASLKSYYEANKSRHQEMGRKWKKRNPSKVREANAKYQQKLKAGVLSAYGAKCVCCGEKDPRFLAIDHVNGDGKEHRKTFTKNFYRLLIDEGFPATFQVMCFNCNIGRFWNGGTCPHREGSTTIP